MTAGGYARVMPKRAISSRSCSGVGGWQRVVRQADPADLDVRQLPTDEVDEGR